MEKIEKRALEILENYPIYKHQPASISGKYHIGETQEEHLKLVNNVLKHLCDEFNIQNEDRDMLLASGWLHDLGMYVITKKGKIDEFGWKYYEVTGYSKFQNLMDKHGSIGAKELEKYNIPRKKEIQKLIACHMSHWYPNEPQPNCLYDYLLCIADYVASRGHGILECPKKKKNS